jgi:hypothetical protein
LQLVNSAGERRLPRLVTPDKDVGSKARVRVTAASGEPPCPSAERHRPRRAETSCFRNPAGAAEQPHVSAASAHSPGYPTFSLAFPWK